MRSIAITKPDMTVLGQDNVGLSPFGILSALFTREVIRRSQQQTGPYSPLPLEFLEEEDGEEPKTSPELTLKLDLELILKTIREELKEKWSSTGRNEPCLCGSGKKYKKCHGRNV